jgi:hypothetical protein
VSSPRSRALELLLLGGFFLACVDPADDDSSPADDDSVEPDDDSSASDDDSAGDADPWPDAEWPEDLQCVPMEQYLGTLCDFELEDQFGNSVHLYEFFGHPLVIVSCRVPANGNLDFCAPWFDAGIDMVQAHPELWWLNILYPLDAEVSREIQAEIASTWSHPRVAVFWDPDLRTCCYPRAEPGGFVTVLSNMQHDGWEDDFYMDADEVPARVEELLAHDAALQ